LPAQLERLIRYHEQLWQSKPRRRKTKQATKAQLEGRDSVL
jgi:hypothetical protein